MLLKNKRLILVAVLAFAWVEYVLAVLLQTTAGRAVEVFSFALVVTACLFCALFVEKSAVYGLTQLALITTVCADYFLVYATEMRQLPAMLFFSITQLCYFGRLLITDSCRRRRRVHLWLRLGLSLFAVLLTLLILRGRTDAVALVSMFYYANLLLNLVFAFLQLEKPGLFAIGLVLFACCDTLVGIGNLYAYLPVDADALNRFLYGYCNLAWVFYAPSQALLALSLVPRRWRQLTQKEGTAL